MRNSPSSSPAPWPRKSARVALSADVDLRRSGHLQFRVKVFDLSRHGCKLEFLERPRLDETVWVKFEGLESLEASVCWVEGFVAGMEFQKPVHPAVFDLMVKRLGPSPAFDAGGQHRQG